MVPNQSECGQLAAPGAVLSPWLCELCMAPCQSGGHWKTTNFNQHVIQIQTIWKMAIHLKS